MLQIKGDIEPQPECMQHIAEPRIIKVKRIVLIQKSVPITGVAGYGFADRILRLR